MLLESMNIPLITADFYIFLNLSEMEPSSKDFFY